MILSDFSLCAFSIAGNKIIHLLVLDTHGSLLPSEKSNFGHPHDWFVDTTDKNKNKLSKFPANKHVENTFYLACGDANYLDLLNILINTGIIACSSPIALSTNEE